MKRSREERAQFWHQKAEWHLSQAEKCETKALGIKHKIKGLTISGQIDPRVGPRDPDRVQQILNARAEGRTLDDVGQEFGVSRERIRQIVDRRAPEINRVAKQKTMSAGSRKRIKRRATVICQNCGKSYTEKPYKTRTCSARCSAMLNGSVLITDDVIIRAIEMRDRGMNWRAIHQEIKLGAQPNVIAGAIYRYLCRENMLTPGIVRSVFYRKYGTWARRHGYPTPSGVPSKAKKSTAARHSALDSLHV